MNTKVEYARDFPGSPVVKTLGFQCRGHGSDPWLGTEIPHAADKKKVEYATIKN